MTWTPHIFVVGISHRTAPVALRERFAVATADRAAALRRVQAAGGLAEVVLLWTCNRVEIYGVSERPAVDAGALLNLLATDGAVDDDACFHHAGDAALRHLFSVAAGLDSLVLGETEIAGQVKEAYAQAREAGLTGPLLNRAFQAALGAAKEVRTATAIGRGATSVGSVVLQRAREHFGDALKERRVLLLGAGKMAETCLLHLAKNGAQDLVVVNRSLERAEQLVTAHGGRAAPQEQLADELAAADLAICSTGCPYVVLDRPLLEQVMAARGGRALVLVDIAVPRDVAPEAAELPGVHLCDMDGLEATVRRNVAHRAEDLAQAQALIAARVREVRERFAAAAGRAEAVGALAE